MKTLLHILTLLLLAGGIFVAYWLTSTAIRYQAIDKCLGASKAQFERDGQNLTGPDGFWYQFCMKEKQLKK